jgi:hypothetical protein
MQMSIGFGGQRRRAVRTAAEPGAPSGVGRDFASQSTPVATMPA